MSRCIYKHDDEPADSAAPSDLAFAALADAMKGLPQPDAIDTVFLDVILEDDEKLDLSLEFWNFGEEDVDEPKATLAITMAGLEDLHRSLGQAISDLKQSRKQ